jgi:hypothetical protein
LTPGTAEAASGNSRRLLIREATVGSESLRTVNSSGPDDGGDDDDDDDR